MTEFAKEVDRSVKSWNEGREEGYADAFVILRLEVEKRRDTFDERAKVECSTTALLARMLEDEVILSIIDKLKGESV